MLTPLDIQNAAFHRSFRGYNEKEVDEFLDRLVIEYEHMYRENLELKQRLASAESAVSAKRESAAAAEGPAELPKLPFPVTRHEPQIIGAEEDATAKRKLLELEEAVSAEKARLMEAKRQYRLFCAQFRAMLTSYYRILGDSETASGVDVAREVEGLYKEAAAAGLE
jgi:cell division initiation protein